VLVSVSLQICLLPVASTVVATFLLQDCVIILQYILQAEVAPDSCVSYVVKLIMLQSTSIRILLSILGPLVLDHKFEYFNNMSSSVCSVHTRSFIAHVCIKKTFLNFIMK
jgi:hypothetical protein